VRAVLATYDGVLSGPGRSQTVPYARGLADRGHDLLLFSYEEPDRLADPAQVTEVERALGGVPWVRLPWRRNAPGDLAAGVRALRRVAREHRADLIHARGYVPALLARLLHLPYVFDMRGFWPDERVDGGLWKRGGAGHRTWKRIERSLLKRAGAVIVLAARGRDELRRTGLVSETQPVHVVPTCTDLQRFRVVPVAERAPEARGAGPRFVILGGTSTWYLPEAMLDLGARALARDDTAVLHVLTQDDQKPVHAELARRGVPAERVVVGAVPHADVPRWISGATAGIALLRPAPSKVASCPTKLGEFLACGVPLIVSGRCGDVDALLAEERVGVSVDDTSPAGLEDGLDRMLALREDPALSDRCRDVAERRFDVSIALDVYERAYREAVT